MEVNKETTILIADDHALVRETLRDRLEKNQDLTVVATVANADEAINETLRIKPDIVLMDIDMPGVLSFEAARLIRKQSPATNIVFLSAFFNDRYIERALAVEASGYVTKNEPPEALIEAIRCVMSGEVYFSPDVRSRIVLDAEGIKLAKNIKSRVSTLTAREVQVLQYIARGLSRKEMAETMQLSLKTIECHCANLMEKLEIHDRVGLARFAIREGLVEP